MTVRPTAEQLRWQELRFGMFCHFAINTFFGMEWSDGTLDPAGFAPGRLDARQWVETAFSAGSGYAITSNAGNADAAWIYLNDYLSTAGQAYMWALTGRGSPARLSAWPAYVESEYAPPGVQNIQDSLTSIASHDILDKPAASRVTQTAGPIWDEVLAGNLSVEEAIEEVCASIEPLLAQNAS